MFTFRNSKVPGDWQICVKQYNIFLRSESYEILNGDIYISEELSLLLMYFTGVSN